jgi:hypothetical protein
MSNHRKIAFLNRLLGSELGTNPFGEPLYSWQFADSLTHQMQKLDPATGRPAYNYRCPCGLNMQVHAASCTLTVVEPVYVVRKLCPELHNQYVATIWCDPGKPEQWLKEFGSRMKYPERGYLCPTNACLEPGIEPDPAATWDLIHKVKEQRKKSIAEWVRESEDALALKERRDESLLDDMISDACTAFGHAKPGTRSGGISFPSVSKAA